MGGNAKFYRGTDKKSRGKKAVILPGKLGTIVSILPWKDKVPLFTHSSPKLPFLLSKMSQKISENLYF